MTVFFKFFKYFIVYMLAITFMYSFSASAQVVLENKVLQDEPPILTEKEIKRREIAALIEQYRDALFDDPGNGVLHQMLAKQYIIQGVADIAEHELNRALDLGVSKPSLLVDFGKAYLIRDKYAQILEEILIDDAIEEDHGEIYLLYGHAYYGLNDLNLAYENYKKAETLIDDRFELSSRFAEIYTKAGEYELSEKHTDISLGFEPKNVDMLMLKGELVHRRSGSSLSYLYFEKAAFYQPENLTAQGKRAGALYNLGHFDEAMIILDGILAFRSDHPLANFLAASISAQNNNIRTAMRYLDSAKDGLDNFVPGLLLKGKLNYTSKSYDQVEDALNKLISIDPNHMEARRILGSALLLQGKSQQAASVLEYIEKQNRLDNIDMILLGSTYLQAGKNDKSSTYFEMAVAQNLNGLSALDKTSLLDFTDGYLKGIQLGVEGIIGQSSSSNQELILHTYDALKRENFDLAFENATKVIDQDSQNPIGYNLLGLSYFGLNKFDEARSNYRKAIEVDPTFHQARRNIAKLELSLGRENEAINSLNEILNVDESYLGAYEELAEIAMSRIDTIRAERYLLTAISANPGSLPARLNLADFYFTQDNKNKAKVAATRILRDFPDFGLSYKIMGKVNMMEGAFDQAIVNFQHSLQQVVSDGESYLILSEAYIKNGESQNSRPLLQSALPKVKNKDPLLIALIKLAEFDGNYKSSFHYVDQMKLDENKKAEAYFYEGELNILQNNVIAAISSFESANKAGGDKTMVIAGLEKIVNSELNVENISKARELLSNLR